MTDLNKLIHRPKLKILDAKEKALDNLTKILLEFEFSSAAIAISYFVEIKLMDLPI